VKSGRTNIRARPSISGTETCPTIKMKVHTRGGEVLVAACDAELIGRTLKEGQLRLHVSSFYDGDVVDEGTFVRQLKMATIGNLVGRATVDAAKRAGLIGNDGVLLIEGVPHAQLFVIVAGEEA